MADIYDKDYLISRLITMGKKVDGYDCVYYQTNEDLVDMYQTVDFTDKSVLSVLASGDQVLTSRMLGAKKVDAFDFNRLTLYYYYLRKWTILYAQSLYPDVTDLNWISALLDCVKPASKLEEKALSFFRKHVSHDSDLEKLFYDIYVQPTGKIMYFVSNQVAPYVKGDIDFTRIDMFEENDLQGNYDIIIMSNILDWSRNEYKKLTNACENIDKLLSEDGVVLCSRLVNRETDLEESIMSDYFKKQDYSSHEYVYRRK